MYEPKFRWMPEHSMQTRIPKFKLAQSGSARPNNGQFIHWLTSGGHGCHPSQCKHGLCPSCFNDRWGCCGSFSRWKDCWLLPPTPAPSNIHRYLSPMEQFEVDSADLPWSYPRGWMTHQMLPPLALFEGQRYPFHIHSCFEQVVRFDCSKGVLQLSLHGFPSSKLSKIDFPTS